MNLTEVTYTELVKLRPLSGREWEVMKGIFILDLWERARRKTQRHPSMKPVHSFGGFLAEVNGLTDCIATVFLNLHVVFGA